MKPQQDSGNEIALCPGCGAMKHLNDISGFCGRCTVEGSNPNPEVSEPQLKEKLAAIEHQRWADWQRWVHKIMRFDHDDDGNEVALIPVDVVNRWERQINTPYDQLSEAEKASDMEQVDRYWPLIQEYVRLGAHSALNNDSGSTTDSLPSNPLPTNTSEPTYSSGIVKGLLDDDLFLVGIENDELRAAIVEWSKQGRTEEQIYGVTNFFTGRGRAWAACSPQSDSRSEDGTAAKLEPKSEIEAEIRATLQTKCYRPGCKVKHRAKFMDSVKGIQALIDKATQYDKVTRFEVIDHRDKGEGRILVEYDVKVQALLQDDGRTLKIRLTESGDKEKK